MDEVSNSDRLLNAWLDELGVKSKTYRFAVSYKSRYLRRKNDAVFESFEVDIHEYGVLIKAKRAQDFTDLTIAAYGYKAKLDPKRVDPYLIKSNKVSLKNLKMAFILPPQIVMEEVYGKEPEPQDFPAEVRLSGKSQIVIKPIHASIKRTDIRIDDLFELLWNGELLVDKRAQASRLNSWKQQLIATFGVNTGPETEQQWREQLKSALQPPSPLTSQFEVIPRLIMSSSEDTEWRPSSPITIDDSWMLGEEQPVFDVSYDRAGRESVRALWSKHLEQGKLPDVDVSSDTSSSTIDKFDTVVEQKYHWDIVGRTSLYGLLALRPSDDDSNTSNNTIESDLSNIDIASPRIIRPTLNEVDTLEIIEILEEKLGLKDQLGLLQADPFQTFNLSFTGYGSTHQANWAITPPSIMPGDLTTGFSLKTFDSSYTIGHLNKLITVEAGYLLPLGISASLVKVAERDITQGPGGEKDGVSYIYQYEFIVCDTAWKSYPAVYQPHEGRGFPADSVQMLTKKTPLIDQHHAKAKLGNVSTSHAFWVVLDDSANDNDTTGEPFVFSWCSKDAPKITSEMVFLSKSAINNTETMEVVKLAYNQYDSENLAEKTKRQAFLGSARHRYAESDTLGDTSFDTIAWLMALQGRVGIDKKEFFNRDGRMEAANQIPLYPRMENAAIRLQTIAALNCETSNVSEVSYHDRYVKHGFEKSEPDNPKKVDAEIFLIVNDQNSKLDVGKKSDKAGGFAGPQVNVGALSRSKGLIGGKAAPSGSAQSAKQFDVSEALAGNYSPEEFLPDGLIMGIDLNSLIEAAVTSDFIDAPELKETVEYGVREVFEFVQEIAGSLRKLLYGSGKLVEKTNQLIAEFDKQTNKEGNFENYYPRLFAALQPFIQENAPAEKLLTSIENANQASNVRVGINELYGYLDTLLKAIERFVKDPIPDAIDTIIEDYKNWLKLFKDSLDSLAETAAKLIKKEATDYLIESFSKLIDDKGYGEALFGPDGLMGSQIFKYPYAALKAMREGMVSYSSEKIWTLFEAIFASLEGFSWPHRIKPGKVKKRAKLAVERATDEFDEQLKEIEGSIRDENFVDKQLTNFLKSLEDLFKSYSTIGTAEGGTESIKVFAQLNDFLDKLPNEIDNNSKQIKDDLRKSIELVEGAPENVKDKVMAKVEPEIDALARDLKNEIKNLQEKIAPAVDKEKEGLVQLGFWLLEQSLTAAPDFLGLSSIATDPEDACRELSEYLQLIALELLPVSENLTQLFDELQVKINAWTAHDKFEERVKKGVLKVIDNIKMSALSRLQIARDELKNINICSEPGKALSLLVHIAGVRGELLEELLTIGDKLDDVAKAGVQPSEIVQGEFSQINKHVAELMVVVSAAKVSEVQRTKLKKSIDVLKDLGIDTDKLQLEQILDSFETHRKSIEDKLRDVKPGELRQFVKKQIDPYVQVLERELTSVLTAPVAYGEELLIEISSPARELTKQLLNYFILGLSNVEELIETLEKSLGNTPIGIFFRSVLDDLKPGRTLMLREINVAKQLIVDLGHINPKIDELTTAWKEIESQFLLPYTNSEGGLLKIIAALQAIKLKDVFEAVIEEFIKPLRDIEEQASLMLRQIVPSRFRTSYTSGFRLRNYPDKEKPIFEMLEPDLKQHLSLSGSFMIDPLEGSREAKIEGRLEAFKINIVPAFPVCSVIFKASTFRSVDGQKPKLLMEIDSVDISDGLRFLDALGPYFGNKGNGPYINLRTAPDAGVTAGVRYVAGLIQLGSLQILNVDFDIGAELPFNGKDANVFLNLANRDRPFLISSPPYAGGGWLNIRMPFKEEKGKDRSLVSVGLVFGGQLSLQYGPLSASAYAYVGIWYLKQNGDWRLTGLFEAGAHGKVAFFSISVFIRMALTHERSGRVHGRVVMVFKFKVGFAKFRYKVTATKEFKRGSSPAIALSEYKVLSAKIEVSTEVPNKRTDWSNYRKHFA